MVVSVEPIRSDEACEAALLEIDDLLRAQRTTEVADRLEVLSILVADYERRKVSLPEPDPVAFLEFAMAAQGRRQSDLARLLGSRSRASEVLKRKRALSAEMIDRIVGEWRLPYERLARQYSVESGAVRLLKRGAAAILIIVVISGTAITGLVNHYSADLPSTADLRRYASGSPTTAGEYTPLSRLPPLLVNAIIAAEDGGYHSHRGTDPLAILRAALTAVPDMVVGKKPATGSTISQQLAKNLLLAGEPPTVRRKIRELVLADRLEETLGKDRILELYVNVSYFGGLERGVASASRFYFGKRPDMLTLSEAAYLAATLKAPDAVRIDSSENHEAATLRRDWVIDRMAEEGMISSADAELASNVLLRPAT